MSYEETIEYLYNAAPAFEKVGAGAYKEGLSNTLALDAHFHHPHRKYLTIHIAGTNGKGSCSHTIAAILQKQGYRVGLYTSPHLVDFRERIRVDGKMIPEERVIRFVEEERSFFETLNPSFFELTTALAFKYFEEQQVDIAVIEVGLGGRLDCTNIIQPILSVITNISFDHTQLLGNTLEAIAGEKAGIIKPATLCVVGEYTAETRPVFERIAAERHAPLYFAQDNPLTASGFSLKGNYQAQNINTILNSIDVLRHKIRISDSAVSAGLANVCELTGLAGRWQTLKERPLTICDTGHNLAGWQFLAPQIKETAEQQRKKAISFGNSRFTLRIVFGMVDDKDVSSVLDLLPADACYYFCQASTHRAIKAETVRRLAETKGLSGEQFDSVDAAYRKASADSTDNDLIFIGGSSYVVADLFTAIGRQAKNV